MNTYNRDLNRLINKLKVVYSYKALNKLIEGNTQFIVECYPEVLCEAVKRCSENSSKIIDNAKLNVDTRDQEVFLTILYEHTFYMSLNSLIEAERILNAWGKEYIEHSISRQSVSHPLAILAIGGRDNNTPIYLTPKIVHYIKDTLGYLVLTMNNENLDYSDILEFLDVESFINATNMQYSTIKLNCNNKPPEQADDILKIIYSIKDYLNTVSYKFFKELYIRLVNNFASNIEYKTACLYVDFMNVDDAAFIIGDIMNIVFRFLQMGREIECDEIYDNIIRYLQECRCVDSDATVLINLAVNAVSNARRMYQHQIDSLIPFDYLLMQINSPDTRDKIMQYVSTTDTDCEYAIDSLVFGNNSEVPTTVVESNMVDTHSGSSKLYKFFKRYKDNEEKVDIKLTKGIDTLKNFITGSDKKQQELVEGKKFSVIAFTKQLLVGVAIFHTSKLALLLTLLIKWVKGGKASKSEKRKLIMMIEEEIELLNEKIDDARSDGDREAKYALMRSLHQLNNARKRLEYGIGAETDDGEALKNLIASKKRGEN